MTNLEITLIALTFILFFVVVYYFNKYYREVDRAMECQITIDMLRDRNRDLSDNFKNVEIYRTKAVADLQKIRNIVDGKGSF